MADDRMVREEHATLRERAVALARPEPHGDAVADRLLVIEFSLAGERYAVEAEYTAEVRAATQVTRLPGVPSHVAGVFAVRGRVVPLVDLRVLLDLPAAVQSDTQKALILHADGAEFGLLADSIDGVRNLSLADIHPPLPGQRDVACPYIRGIDGCCLTILDGQRLLTDEHLVVNQDAEV